MGNYLYNGVELPDINEVWTDDLKKQYPYAYIKKSTSSSNPYYNLELFSSITTVAESDEWIYKYVKQTGPFVWVRCYLNNQPLHWEEPYFSSFNNIVLEAPAHPAHPCIWSNTNILNADGSVFFAASDPIPVPPLNHAALMQGFATMLSLKK